MDTAAYALLFFGALAGGFVSGLAGFGTALMALGIWLYVVPPSIAVPLVLICSVVAQTSTLPSIWRTIDFRLVWPFLIGGLAGVPIGTQLIARGRPKDIQADHRGVSAGVSGRAVFPAQADGVHLRRPDRRRAPSDLPAASWAASPGYPDRCRSCGPACAAGARRQRRGIFQTFNWHRARAALGVQIASGFVKPEVFWLALIAFPGTILGAWAGARIYHALERPQFLATSCSGLLFLSGIGLVWSSIGH